MAEQSPPGLWRRFLTLPNESRIKTFGVALLVALASALTVSVTSVMLRPLVLANIAAEREAKLAEMIKALPWLEDILRHAGAETLDAVVVDLRTGRIDEDVNAASFDYEAVQSDPGQGTALAPEEDSAGIGSRPNLAPAFLLRGADGLALVILPVYGTGYQSTIRAYLALEGDLDTIAGLSIYEQGETPGLGSRIADPAWTASWSGKVVSDEAGAVAITVVRGSATSLNEVDGISGATRSTTGVANLVRFWLGPLGYGPFLANLKLGEG